MSTAWRERRILLLTVAIAGLFVLDLRFPREVPLLPCFLLPVLLATAFAGGGRSHSGSDWPRWKAAACSRRMPPMGCSAAAAGAMRRRRWRRISG